MIQIIIKLALHEYNNGFLVSDWLLRAIAIKQNHPWDSRRVNNHMLCLICTVFPLVCSIYGMNAWLQRPEEIVGSQNMA